MAVDYRFKFPLPNGLHARPASHFEAVTSRFRSKITLIHERTCVRANARSVLSMVSADVRFDDPCCIHVDGDDEQPALAAVRRFLDIELPHCDEPLPEIPADTGELVLPRSLKATGLTRFIRGRAVSGGVGIGQAVSIGQMEIPPGVEDETASDPGVEQQRAQEAITAVGAAMQRKIESTRHTQEAEVLKAHAAIVRDTSLLESITAQIQTHHRTAAGAIVEASRGFKETLLRSQSAYLRERVLDVHDICIQLLGQVMNLHGVSHTLTAPSVCIADHLTPGQLLGLNREFLKGVVLSEGSLTSHTVILARSMNIPTLVGVVCPPSAVRSGQQVIVDGELGVVVTDVSQPVRRYYALEQARLDQRRRQLDSFLTQEGMTRDQHPVEVAANIAGSEESVIAFQNGAQGIGLFRTEMLFMDRDAAPTEDEQTRIYTDAIAAGKGRPVIIRLLDIGGDKPAPYLNLAKEENPFLGYRGARLYREFSALVKDQLRAILRASVAGNVRILVPMICCLEEVREVRAMIRECAGELVAAGVKIGPTPEFGIMLEVPSLAFLMPELCSEVDFFSIGSNDLTQYFLAVDRANQQVAGLYTWSHPAFLRLLKSLADQAKAHGKWIGLCGEMGDQAAALPLLIGLGLDEISVSPPRVSGMKSSISALQYSDCRQLLDEVLRCGTREAVEAAIQASPATSRKLPLLSSDLIFNADAHSKEEVIKQLADRMFLAGRVVKPQLLEEAIWNREDTYSTGFGFGFSLPHCKSDHLSANSICIARLGTPVEWGSLDGKPVDVVILLAIRAQENSREHMKIFARLSRLVMRDEFRDRVREEIDPAQLVRFLEESLGPETASS